MVGIPTGRILSETRAMVMMGLGEDERWRRAPEALEVKTAEIQLTPVDVLKHHSAHLERSAQMLAAKEAGARRRLEAFALGRPLTARMGEWRDIAEHATEQRAERYHHRDIVAESEALISKMYDQLIDDDRSLLRHVSLALRIAALPVPEQEAGSELEPNEQAERSLFPASSLPPSLETIANQQYQRGVPTGEGMLVMRPILQFPRGDDTDEPHSALAGFEATLAAARKQVAENTAQQARLAKAQEVSLAAATERGQAMAALSFEKDVAAELAASSLRLERGLEEERAANEVSVLFWGVGELGLRIRRRRFQMINLDPAIGTGITVGPARSELDDSNSSNGDLDFMEAERVHERLTLHSVVNPLAPRKYGETAAWLKMVGMQAQDEMDGETVGTTGVPAFRPAAAEGFAAVFHPSPMPDANGRGLSETNTERGKRRLAESDHFRFDCQARRSLVPGLTLRSIDGELLDPAELPSAELLRQRLLRDRVGVGGISSGRNQSAAKSNSKSKLGIYPQLPSTAGLSLVFEESAYTAVFYEPCPPQLVLRERSRKNEWGSQVPGPSILERVIERRQTRQADRKVIGEGCSLLRRTRLSEAKELGMVLATINCTPVMERSLVEVRELLASATRQISEQNPLKLCFIPRQGSCLYYGGVHGHRGRECSATPADPSPVYTLEAWTAVLAASLRENAARRAAMAHRVAMDGRTPQWYEYEMDSRKAHKGLAACYHAKYGDDRPAVDKEIDWGGY